MFIKKTIIFLLINLLIAFSFVNSNAQIQVSLRLDESAQSLIGKFLLCDKDYNCGLSQNEKSKVSEIDELKIPIKIWRTGKNFYLLIDTNGNKKLTDEKKILLENNSKVTVKIKRNLESGKSLWLPFEILHQTYEKDGLVTDTFKMIPHYIAVGTLSYKNCTSKIGLSDMNFDGNFNMSDARRGTNLHIDKNNDGKFWGKEEHGFTSGIVEFCGQKFLISSLDNKSLTLSPTNLELAKVGEMIPEFSLTSLNGEMFNRQNLQGKMFVFDFWASWCIPCVENLQEIKILEKEIPNLLLISVNVDEKSRRDKALGIIERFDLNKNAVIRGLGAEDNLWKTFGAIDNNQLSIPLYVLTDKDGIVRYSGQGGKDLIQLKTELKKLTEK